MWATSQPAFFFTASFGRRALRNVLDVSGRIYNLGAKPRARDSTNLNTPGVVAWRGRLPESIRNYQAVEAILLPAAHKCSAP